MNEHERDPVMDACWEALDAWDGVEPGPTFRARVWERIRSEPPPRTSWLGTLRDALLNRRLLGAVACLLLLVAGIVRYSPQPAPAPMAENPVDTSEVVAYVPEWDVDEIDVFPELSEMTADEELELPPVEDLGYVSDSWLGAAHEALGETL
ncbi:MAG: hypothetical protein HY319_11715 [Armatimonadetes bacterium]|nr:hypothetical protein [Armatimonadota bacterium]